MKRLDPNTKYDLVRIYFTKVDGSIGRESISDMTPSMAVLWFDINSKHGSHPDQKSIISVVGFMRIEDNKEELYV